MKIRLNVSISSPKAGYQPGDEVEPGKKDCFLTKNDAKRLIDAGMAEQATLRRNNQDFAIFVKERAKRVS